MGYNKILIIPFFQFAIIEFDGETFRILLGYLHCGSCPLSCLNIPGLICAAEHYDLPELLQACFHHAKQFIRVDKVLFNICFEKADFRLFTFIGMSNAKYFGELLLAVLLCIRTGQHDFGLHWNEGSGHFRDETFSGTVRINGPINNEQKSRGSRNCKVNYLFPSSLSFGFNSTPSFHVGSRQCWNGQSIE